MKNALFIALFFLLSTASYGQKIHFSDSTNVWKVKKFWYGPGVVNTSYITLSYSGSIIIDSRKYQILGGEYIHEDTVANKVYIRTPTDTIENLLYDYNLMPGDTQKNIVNQSPFILSNWITRIDSTQINGKWYKVWYFEGNSSWPGILETYIVVEGIGSILGFDYPINTTLQESAGQFNEQVLCFRNSNAAYALSNPVFVVDNYAPSYNYTFDNATSCTLATNQITKKSSSATIIPNPINETIKIVFSYNIPSGSLVVLNDIGQVVVNTTFQDKEELLIGDKISVPGIYFYRLTDGLGDKTFTGKFIYR